MCTLVVYFRVFPQYPLVIAANRDEALTRPSSPPTLLASTPWIYGGQDLLAGGTWLGINEHGLMAAVLNRRAQNPVDPRCRSRGLLCLDALKHHSAHAALQGVTAQPAAQYNPFSLVVADPSAASLIYPDDYTLQVRHLTPGVYMITNLNLNDPECPRIARFSQRFLQVSQNHHSTLLSCRTCSRSCISSWPTTRSPRSLAPVSASISTDTERVPLPCWHPRAANIGTSTTSLPARPVRPLTGKCSCPQARSPAIHRRPSKLPQSQNPLRLSESAPLE